MLTFNNNFTPRVKWSITKEKIFWDCPKKFYFHYEMSEYNSYHLNKDEILKLKKLKSLPLLCGEITHSSILDYISAYKYNYKDKDILKYFIHRCEQSFKSPQNTLLEYTNNTSISNHEINEKKAQIEECLHHFHNTWDEYANKDIIYIRNPNERPTWFLCDKYCFYTTPDIIINEDKYTIVIFKSIYDPWKSNELVTQISAAIYLVHFDNFGNIRHDLNKIKGYFHFLRNNSKSDIYTCTDADYSAFRKSVADSLGIIPKDSISSNYPTKPDQFKCPSCNFASICEDGMKYIKV